MPDKDKVESLLKLADFSWRDYSERRSIEWKTNFALWLALGAFAGFMFEQQAASWITNVTSGLTTFPAFPAVWTSNSPQTSTSRHSFHLAHRDPGLPAASRLSLLLTAGSAIRSGRFPS